MKRYLLAILFLVILPIKVNASCTNEDIVLLQKLANNVTINYSFDEDTKQFEINFTNVDGRLSIRNIDTNKEYYSTDELTIGNVKSGVHTFYVYASDKNCYDEQLSIKNVKIPYYNEYYSNKECNGIGNYRYCSKWLPSKITYSEWHEYVINYKNKLKEQQKEEEANNERTIVDDIRDFIVDLYVTKYYIFLPVTILALCAIIYLKNKSDQLI